MPEKKKKKGKDKGGKAVDTFVLKKFLKTYENHCTQSQSVPSPTIKRALKQCIEDEARYTRITVSPPGRPPEDSLPVLLRPLLMTIRDERYMQGTDLCVWGIPLGNQDVACLAIILELRGRTCYPFSRLEAIDCHMDVWSVERLGKAMEYSHLTSLTLDYNEFGDEGLQGLVQGIEGNKKLVYLSLCYCNLGPACGALLGKVLAESAISELYLNGNYLQCSGAVDLITGIAEYAQSLAMEEAAEVAINPAHQILEAHDNAGIHTAVSGTASSKDAGISPVQSATKKKGKRKGSKKKKKAKSALPPGPWVSKLHLADNGIDAMGQERDTGVLEFSQLLSSLIKYSEQLSELDLDDNCIGELPANDILEALTERNKGKLPHLKIKVTAQLPSTIFKSILKNSKKLKASKKKRKKKVKK
ncbi:uncharacterized protein O3C94_003857 [Discoglossus pictus]